ncbi:MAG: alpha/beta fold hydrolase [Bacteroidales bacterium]|nr:alpha/beta fold hydrolase [Bacteroidales bacterium]
MILNSEKINYKLSGSGIPLVLLHGYLESVEIWNGFGAKLSKTFKVLMIDLPGHGKSASYEEINKMEDMAAQINEITEELGFHNFFLIGHSLGGYVSLAFLELFPEKLLGISLFHSHPLADSTETIEKRKREIELVMHGRKELICQVNIAKAFADENLEKFKIKIDLAKQIAINTPDKGVIATLKGMIQRPDRSQLLMETSLPFLWILGEKDNYIPYPDITKKVSLPLNTSLVVLQNSGHQGFLEEEKQSLEVIEEFIQKYLTN